MAKPDFTIKEKYAIEDLLEILALLRGEGGCPWDQEQTHESIKLNLLEEAYEAFEGIETQDASLLEEELGDVLLQVAFHAQIEKEAGGFDFAQVCNGICQKLIERHPHVFGAVQADTSEQVLRNWDRIKQRHKGQTTYTQTLESVPKVFPALMRAQKVQKRAAKSGFDYSELKFAFEEMESEVDELKEAIAQNNQPAMEEELGDLLFAAVNVSRFINAQAELALGNATEKFIKRFAKVEQLAASKGIDMHTSSMQELDDLWKEIKLL